MTDKTSYGGTSSYSNSYATEYSSSYSNVADLYTSGETSAQREARRAREELEAVRKEEERKRAEAELVGLADKVHIDEQRTIDALEEQRFLTEEKAYKSNVDRYDKNSESLIAGDIRHGQMTDSLTEKMVQHEADMEEKTVLMEDRERMIEQAIADEEQRRLQTAVQLQMQSDLGILNPAYGTAHVPPEMAAAASAAPPVYLPPSAVLDAPTSGRSNHPIFHRPVVGSNVSTDLESSTSSFPAGSYYAHDGGLDRDMSTRPAAGGRGAAVAVSLDSHMSSRPARGSGQAVKANVAYEKSMPTHPVRSDAAKGKGGSKHSLFKSFFHKSKSEGRASANVTAMSPMPLQYNQPGALFIPGQSQADLSFWPTSADADKGFDFARCYSCFDPIAPNVDKGYSGRAMRGRPAGNGRDTLYHVECYKKKGDHGCYYCLKPLTGTPGKSGAWGVCHGRPYHAECFQNYAGPRCAICLDMVFANPDKNLSGKWLSVADDRDIVHLECYTRLIERAGGAVIPTPAGSKPLNVETPMLTSTSLGPRSQVKTSQIPAQGLGPRSAVRTGQAVATTPAVPTAPPAAQPVSAHASKAQQQQQKGAEAKAAEAAGRGYGAGKGSGFDEPPPSAPPPPYPQ